ncbi:PREDICTED: sodium channel protein Nach-like [Papilio polytes]|uniref:sodium channel protein Nach-like n=1 Tax=Papilio polytes TaxID=76194 RepID=UPI0006765C17|nr:PREDICTED: sodium channel protein Nach-like [Papilio polytes]
MTKKTKHYKNMLLASLPTITTLHGTNQFSVLSGRKIILWRFLMLLNMILTIAFVLVIKNRYNNDQILTRISNKCQLNETPFPAVSICNFNTVSLRESQTITRILKNHGVLESDVILFLYNLHHLRDYSYSAQNVSHFTEIMTILKDHYFTVESIMEEVRQKCDKLLLHCTFNRKVKNCVDMFRLIKTHDGHCCTFNYAALNDDSKGSVSAKDEDIEYYEDPSGEDATTNQPVVVTSESGRGSGLSVILNVEPDDYPDWSGVPYYGAKILISDPNDYPEITVSYRFISLEESLDLKIQPLVFQCEEDIRNVSPEKRACYISEDQRACDPVCYMECWDKRYRVTSDITPFVPDMFPPSVINTHNVSELSALQVYYAKSTCNSYKLMLLMDFNYFIGESVKDATVYIHVGDRAESSTKLNGPGDALSPCSETN